MTDTPPTFYVYACAPPRPTIVNYRPTPRCTLAVPSLYPRCTLAAEYSVLGAMLRARSANLPSQLAFELHWRTQMTTLSWYGRTKTLGEIATLARLLYDAGYRALSREDNRRCPHCSEFNVVRLFCPPAPPELSAEVEEAAGDSSRVGVPPADGAADAPGRASDKASGKEGDLGLGWGPADPGQGC